MTNERAREISDAFGHCTVVYECLDIDEIVEDAADRTESALCAFFLDVEEIHADREGGAIYKEWRNDMRPGVIARLRELGIRPRSDRNRRP